MIVILLLAIVIFFVLLYITRKNNKIQYHVIHLKHETRRLEHIKNIENILGQKIKIFDANPPEVYGEFKPGVVGCYKSHKKLLESVKGTPGYTVIFEDDVIFPKDFHQQIKDIVNKLDDFDIVYLGNLDGNHATQIIDNIYRIDPTRLLTGMHAYIVKNKHTDKITRKLKFKTAIDLEIPELIHTEGLNGYVIWPSLASQNSSFPSATR